MPHNKSESLNERERRDSMQEEATTLKPDKQKEFPPSLNQISKHRNR
ncbi:hypothetical protein [Marinicrinis lubricantis]|uniref:Uncharacterized protein n=1 Tax=Marinicrinis lubricantis TaxID=2086470 RepID=A0ABW1IL90_9BACL